MTTVEHRDRRFQLWAYSVSMGRLLLRSTKGEDVTTRVDVLFQNVAALSLPASMMGVVVRSADADEQRWIADSSGVEVVNGRAFVVEGDGYRGYVVAGVVVEAEDDGDYFEPSALWPDSAGVS
jgi:ribonucleotide reductase alpha subunit